MRVPRVSVGIPVYNGENYLQTAIDSVLAQDYEDFELVISDNASTDRTADICRDYAAADRRVRYFRNRENIGAVPNFNRVFALARGRYFKWLSSDDVCYPALLRRCVEILEAAPTSVTLVYPFCEMINEHDDFHGALIENVETRARHPFQRLRKVLLKRTSAQALLGLIRSDHLRLTRLRGSYVMDDMGLLAELALIGQFWQLPEVLLKIRIHPMNASKMHTGTRSHEIWLDPANAGKSVVLNPELRLFIECFRSVMHVPVRPVNKFLCCITALEAYFERPLRNLGGRWRNRLFTNDIANQRRQDSM
jgi:glycosyltransferase involved in cell wall biosynthesis